MLLLLLIVSIENGPSLIVTQIKSSFTLCSFSAAKLIHFVSILKQSKNISLLLFHDYFKFIQSYRILLTNCKHSSFSSLQFERRLNFIIISCIYFLVYSNKKSYLCNRNQTNSHRNIRKTIKKSSFARGKT